MALTIHGHPWSINTRKVLTTLAEKGHEARLALPLAALGVAPDEAYELTELLSGARRLCRGPYQSVTLDPLLGPAVIWRLGRWRRREQDFDYFA